MKREQVKLGIERGLVVAVSTNYCAKNPTATHTRGKVVVLGLLIRQHTKQKVPNSNRRPGFQTIAI